MNCLTDVSNGTGRPCGKLCFVCNCQHLVRLNEVGRELWPEPKQLDPVAAEALSDLVHKLAKKTSSIEGML